ncbi:unnamed protein product [Trifolium pratense]|uniref:Uncharacterized protein n=1 Tax=Trifolium pratense TaxID=57577 RepID=A0ACB0KE10_TRIPR|nr:unnamed protein product [Trifolium pratense]
MGSGGEEELAAQGLYDCKIRQISCPSDVYGMKGTIAEIKLYLVYMVHQFFYLPCTLITLFSAYAISTPLLICSLYYPFYDIFAYFLCLELKEKTVQI